MLLPKWRRLREDVARQARIRRREYSPRTGRCAQAVIGQIKSALPESHVMRLRRLLAPRESKDQAARQVLSQEVLDRFCMKDCYYTQADLDQALDLMAICVK
jgi:hypothetical protein